MTDLSILITGATGLVGNNITRQLSDAGRQVRVLVRRGYDRRAFEGLSVEIIEGDIRDSASVEQACNGSSAVIHAAGHVQLGQRNLEFHRAINVEGTRIVAHAAQRAGVRMIHVSSCDTIESNDSGEPADENSPHRQQINVPYVISKREAELEVRRLVDEGLDAVIVNPGFMLGPWDWKPSSGTMLLEVARGRGLLAPRGEFSVCDVRDVAAAIVAALDPQVIGSQYLLAGETMLYLDAWRLFAEISGGRRPICRAGPLIQKIGGWGGDVWSCFSKQEAGMNSGALALASRPKRYSSSRAMSDLGYQIRPFRESVRDAWQWFVDYGYAVG